MRLRQILLMTVIVAVLSTAVVGTGSFSAVSAERGMSAEVVGDSEAYMALEYSDDAIVLQESEQYLDRRFLTLVNNFGVSVDMSLTSVDVTASDGLTVDTESVNDEPIGPGDELLVTADITCDTTGVYSPSISFDVVADGDSVYVRTTEEREVTFDVRCELFREIRVIGNAKGMVDGEPFPRVQVLPASVEIESVSVDDSAVSAQSTNSNPVTLACDEPTNGTKTVTVDLEIGNGQTALAAEKDVSVNCMENGQGQGQNPND